MRDPHVLPAELGFEHAGPRDEHGGDERPSGFVSEGPRLTARVGACRRPLRAAITGGRGATATARSPVGLGAHEAAVGRGTVCLRPCRSELPATDRARGRGGGAAALRPALQTATRVAARSATVTTVERKAGTGRRVIRELSTRGKTVGPVSAAQTSAKRVSPTRARTPESHRQPQEVRERQSDTRRSPTEGVVHGLQRRAEREEKGDHVQDVTEAR